MDSIEGLSLYADAGTVRTSLNATLSGLEKDMEAGPSACWGERGGRGGGQAMPWATLTDYPGTTCLEGRYRLAHKGRHE